MGDGSSTDGKRALLDDLVGPDLRQLAALIPDNIMVLDRDERIRFINWTVPDLTVEQVLGTLPYEYVEPEHRERTRACYRGVLISGEEQRVETEYLAQDGSVSRWETRARPILRGDHVEGILVVSTNVTQRDEAAADRDRFFDLSLDLLCVATLSGYFKRINPAFTAVLGWSEEELLTKPYMDFVHADDHESTQRAVEHLREGAELVRFENRYRCASGGYCRLQWSARSLPRLGLIYAVGRDITATRELEGRLRQTQKMEAVGQLAGGIAHDFNNLLLAVMLNTDLARNRIDDERAVAHLDEAKLAVDRAVALTRQLLAFGRQQPVQIEDIDLNEIAEHMLKLLRRTIPERITLVFSPGDDLPAFRADVVQVEQVLMNLCINARDALAGSGRIAVETGITEVDDDDRSGRFVFASVTDDGVGMSPAVRERAFEPFFTTKAPNQGTGLGLAVVYGIVKRHGGFIRVDGQPGEGTRVTVYFPAGDSRAIRAVQPPTATDVRGGNETILVAEDAPAVREAVVTVLRNAGYHVLVATNGRQALELIAAHGDRIALALLDVVMPELSGPDTAAVIRGDFPDIRVLFTTGYSQVELLGPDDAEAAIRKPYDPANLLYCIRTALDA